MKIDRKLIIVLVSFGMFACGSDNNIYVDLEHQTIRRCSGNGIRRLDISNDSLNTSYTVSWKSEAEAPSEVKLFNIDPRYTILLNGVHPVKVENFKLLSKVSYHINHVSNGDAASGNLLVYIENGLIKNTSKANCE